MHLNNPNGLKPNTVKILSDVLLNSDQADKQNDVSCEVIPQIESATPLLKNSSITEPKPLIFSESNKPSVSTNEIGPNTADITLNNCDDTRDTTVTQSDEGNNKTNDTHSENLISQCAKTILEKECPKKQKSTKKRKNKDLSDDEEMCFNYMTGLYEKVKKIRTAEHEETFDEIECDISFEETFISQDESAALASNSNGTLAQVSTVKNKPDKTILIQNAIEGEEQSLDSSAKTQNTMLLITDQTHCNDFAIISQSSATCHKSNTNYNPNSNLTCRACTYEAVSKKQLMLHLYKTHLQQEYLIQFKCKICNFITHREEFMSLHEQRHILSQEIREDISLSKSVEIKLLKKDSTLNVADEEDREILELSDSDDSDTPSDTDPQKFYNCFDCDYQTRAKESLQTHAVLHSNSKFICTKHSTSTRDCIKCIYQICLLNLKSERVTRNRAPSQRPPNHNAIIKDTNCKDVYKCYDCEYEGTRHDHLQNHAVKHVNSKFKCVKHSMLRSDCMECLYYSCLLNLESKMITCERCGFRTCRPDFFKRHICKIDGSVLSPEHLKPYKCFDCDVRTTRKDSLKRHAEWQHMYSKFECKQHPTLRHDCTECIYQSCLVNTDNKKVLDSKINKAPKVSDSEVNKAPKSSVKVSDSEVNKARKPSVKVSDSEVNKDPKSSGNISDSKVNKAPKSSVKVSDSEVNKARKPYKCFDCDFRSSTKDSLQRHAGQHIGHSFDCRKHRTLRNDCSECIFYQSCLLNENKIKEKYRSDKKKHNFYKCFDCNYISPKKQGLEQHVAQHANSEFTCKKHSSLDNDCLLCIYQSCLANIKQKLLKCHICDYKTYRSERFKIHKHNRKHDSTQ